MNTTEVTANKILLCSDIDRTLIPNGSQPESPGTREMLHCLTSHPSITLAYVSNRSKALLQEAIKQYDLPVPQYAIGDVGTTIYEINKSQWRPWQAWSNEIAPDWCGQTPTELARLMTDVLLLEPQEAEKQNTYKLSYYTPAIINQKKLFNQIQQRLERTQIKADLIWSLDEATQTGLLDILPKSANKLNAIRFLMQHKAFGSERTVFAGDSGNDLPVLTSNIKSILVANAQASIKAEAVQALHENQQNTLYISTGKNPDWNGNYATGVVEGVLHYFPELKPWLTANLGIPA